MPVRPDGRGRDYAWASEVAAQRPLLMTRIHCEPEWEEAAEGRQAVMRGDRGTRNDEGRLEITEDASAEFNRRLREG